VAENDPGDAEQEGDQGDEGGHTKTLSRIRAAGWSGHERQESRSGVGKMFFWQSFKLLILNVLTDTDPMKSWQNIDSEEVACKILEAKELRTTGRDFFRSQVRKVLKNNDLSDWCWVDKGQDVDSEHVAFKILILRGLSETNSEPEG
jgi:hypothetical protein